MSLTTATVTFDISDLTGADFDARRTKVWVTTNVADGIVVDTVGNAIRVGDGLGQIADDGTGTVTVWVPGTGSNPTTWQTYIHLDYAQRRPGGARVQQTFGPFTITANADLADLIAEQAVPPTYLSEVTGLLQGYVTDAETAATAAIAAAAQAVDVSNIGVPDALVATLLGDDTSAASTVLAAEFGTVWHVVLCAGQSNMSGRGVVDATYDVPDARVYQYAAAGPNAGSVVSAVEPLAHYDTIDLVNGVGPALPFARWHAGGPRHNVLLVPVAYGGTGFSSGLPNTWDPAASGTTSLYKRAIAQANAAMTWAAANGSAVFDAILWVQGEEDARVSMTGTAYAAKLDALIDGFRAGITGATATTPFILGRMAPEYIASTGFAPTAPDVDYAHRATPSRKLYTAVVSGPAGHTSDNTHYDASAQRIIGKAMADAFATARAASALVAAPLAAFSEPFTRADSTTTLGSNWTAQRGTWGISTNKAYLVTAAGGGFQTAVHECNSGNGIVAVTLSGSSPNLTDSAICVRASDVDNYWLFRVGGTSGEIYKVVAGGTSLVASPTLTNGASVVLSVVLSGNTLTFKVDGTTVQTVTDSFNAGATKHGLWASATGSTRADDFTFTP